MKHAARPVRGEVPVRLIVFGLVGIGLLVVPLWWLKREARIKTKVTDAAERAANATPALAAPAPTPDRFGLTFGWQPAAAGERVFASCLGAPPPTDNPRHDACNPDAGDTSCRTALPLLCVRGNDAAAFALATTDAVAGFTLASRADADARCAAELGAGWRIAAYGDGGGMGGELRGTRAGSVATHLRAWVAVDMRRGSCWDPPP